jgi:hypothetical protein
MNTVYLLLKHPQHPYQLRAFMEAATVEAVYADKAQADAIAAAKNKRAMYKHWSVKAKRVTPQAA